MSDVNFQYLKYVNQMIVNVTFKLARICVYIVAYFLDTKLSNQNSIFIILHSTFHWNLENFTIP